MRSSRLEVVRIICSWEIDDVPEIKGNDPDDQADKSWVGNKGPGGNSLADSAEADGLACQT